MVACTSKKKINLRLKAKVKEKCVLSRQDLYFQTDIFRMIFQPTPMKKNTLYWLSSNVVQISVHY